MHPKKGWLPLAGLCLTLAAAVAIAAGNGAVPGGAPAATPAEAPKAATKVVPKVTSKAAEGPHRDWKNISLLYLSDVKGKVEPCG